MKIFKIILVIVCTALVAVLSLVFYERYSVKNIDENNLPKIIQADWIDLKRIGSISKFRSGSGHDFSGNGETCRSMKHYFNTPDTREKMLSYDRGNGIPPKPDGVSDISIYSPVDGKITAVESEQMPIGEQVYIRSKSHPDYTVRLFHIYLESDIKDGSEVSAGQKIGVISQYQNTDIAITVGEFSRNYVSYFDVMPDEIFSKYQAAGIMNRGQLIITKEYRDAHPLECLSERFAKNYDDSGDEYAYINGYQRGDW